MNGDYYYILEKFLKIKLWEEKEIICNTSNLIEKFFLKSIPNDDSLFYSLRRIINEKISKIHKEHQEKYDKYTEYRDYIKKLNAKFIYLVVENDSKKYIKDIEPSDAEDNLLHLCTFKTPTLARLRRSAVGVLYKCFGNCYFATDKLPFIS